MSDPTTSDRLSVVQPEATADERAAEMALRPRRLDECIGQERVRQQLKLVLDAARGRGSTPDHVLFSGPPGLGKTTMAMIMANEMGVPLRITSGPAITHAGDLAAILSSLTEGEVLFLDEIHRMARPGRGDALPRHGGLPRRRRRREGTGRHGDPALAPAVHPRRGHHQGRAAAWTAARPVRVHGPPRLLHRGRARTAARALSRAAGRSRSRDDGAVEIAGRSRGTPRIANRLLRRVRDFAQVEADGVVDLAAALRRAGAVRGR